ncbi:hypothetical protein PFICI_02400 [Pestalotiopsis fici W106-1]|uniref:Uncharacterized protein n=1 Tax=Pestalotiopsis fici (strain W106-1 / CGMCC3.15140) TaxID=1229662 RepID=W3XE98_PESFW|nr:uncharacterized protein PFICI_02400 [Pestalotiopsis fici W106-1]ETS84375.1 hypothetical protein PFICI_02400 [Pestalotiopsis fici W106-1]
MGVQSSTASDLITIDEDYSERVVLRRDLVARHGSTVCGYTSKGQDTVRELYEYLLKEYLPVRFPTLFKLSHDGTTFMNLVTQKLFPTTPPQDTYEALKILAETVEEDFFFLKPTPSGHEVVAFVCCFPSGWNPSSKLGKNMNQIHVPVPSYEKIGQSMERYFNRLKVGDYVKRVNWAVQTHPDLFNLKGNHVSESDKIDSNEVIDIKETFLRSELQTLTRLPQTGAILFSFKTYLYPVREIKAEGRGLQFADAIEGLRTGNAPGMWTYKGGIRWGKQVCDYLRSQS